MIDQARASVHPWSTDRQEVDLLATAVRREDDYVDQGVSVLWDRVVSVRVVNLGGGVDVAA